MSKLQSLEGDACQESWPSGALLVLALSWLSLFGWFVLWRLSLSSLAMVDMALAELVVEADNDVVAHDSEEEHRSA